MKEDELRNVRSECASNYNKRLEEITLRLNEKDLKLTATQEENKNLMENVQEYLQQVYTHNVAINGFFELKTCIIFFLYSLTKQCFDKIEFLNTSLPSLKRIKIGKCSQII